MEQITKLSVDILKVHPRNTEFFDDIQGEQYEKFKNSIEEDGILTPLIVSPDMTIISGHQRYQAAKDLNMGLVPIIIKEELLDEDEKLKKLLATNFGRLDNNEMKQSRVITTYEELCEIRKGGDRKSNGNNFPLITQTQIANELGISARQLRNLKDLQKLIPDLQNMVENNELSATTGYTIYAKMPKEEQEKFLNEIGKDKIKELTQKATKELLEEKRKLEQALKEEQSKPPKTVTQVVKEVVDNTDYSMENKYKSLQKELQNKINLYDILEERLEIYERKIKTMEDDDKEYKDLKRSIELLTKEKDDMSRYVASATELSGYIYEIEKVLQDKLAPIKYSRALVDCKENPTVIENVLEIVNCVRKWCTELESEVKNINNEMIEVEEVEYEEC